MRMLKNIAREHYTEAIRMAWPAVLESVFVSLAGIIDTFMVSSIGTYAVAATGLIIQPKFLSLSFFFAINVAVSALVARRLGQNGCNSYFCKSVNFDMWFECGYT